jgi:WD40 repeat protein
MVLVGMKEGSRVFDATSAGAISPVLQVRLRESLPTPAVFSPDGTVVIIFEEKQASVWNVRTGERVALLPLALGPHEEAPPDAIFAKTGALCFVMDPDGTVTRYDAKSWKPLGRPMRHPRLETAYEFGFTASEDCRFIATFDDAGENGPKGQLQVWDAIANKPLGAPLVTTNGFSARFIPGADRILIQPARGDASVRELPSMKTAYAIRAHDDLDGPKIEVSPDGKWILSWGPDRKLDVIDAKTGKVVGNTSSAAAVTKILFGPEAADCYVVFDNTAFFLQDYHDGYVMKMSLPELDITGSLRTLEFLARVSLSPNGQRLLLVEGKTDQERILVFETERMKPIAPD